MGHTYRKMANAMERRQERDLGLEDGSLCKMPAVQTLGSQLKPSTHMKDGYIGAPRHWGGGVDPRACQQSSFNRGL